MDVASYICFLDPRQECLVELAVRLHFPLVVRQLNLFPICLLYAAPCARECVLQRLLSRSGTAKLLVHCGNDGICRSLGVCSCCCQLLLCFLVGRKGGSVFLTDLGEPLLRRCFCLARGGHRSIAYDGWSAIGVDSRGL